MVPFQNMVMMKLYKLQIARINAIACVHSAENLMDQAVSIVDISQLVILELYSPTEPETDSMPTPAFFPYKDSQTATSFLQLNHFNSRQRVSSSFVV